MHPFHELMYTIILRRPGMSTLRFGVANFIGFCIIKTSLRGYVSKVGGDVPGYEI